MKSINILLIAIVILLGVSVYQLRNLKTIEQINALWGARLPTTDVNGDTDFSIRLLIPTFQPEPPPQQSAEEIANGVVTIAETFLRIGEAVHNSCEEKIVNQESFLDKKIGNARDHIVKGDRLSAEIEIASIRWQNTCGASTSDSNKMNSERYEAVRKILMSSLEK